MSSPLKRKASSSSVNDDNELQCKRNKYYMAVAVLMKRFSTDPEYQVGACIVDEFEDTIVSTGYNHMPRGCENFSWVNKHDYVGHAELNAIAKCKKAGGVTDCTLYSSLAPCNECAKLIVQSRIKKVYYLSNDKSHKAPFIAAKKMLDAANIPSVQLRYYQSSDNNILIDWDKETFPKKK